MRSIERAVKDLKMQEYLEAMLLYEQAKTFTDDDKIAIAAIFRIARLMGKDFIKEKQRGSRIRRLEELAQEQLEPSNNEQTISLPKASNEGENKV